MEYISLVHRLFADLDNERIFEDVVGLTKFNSDEMKKFDGEVYKVCEGEYVYLYMDAGIEDGKMGYAVAEGIVMANLGPTTHKWVCKLAGPIEWLDEYNNRMNTDRL